MMYPYRMNPYRKPLLGTLLDALSQIISQWWWLLLLVLLVGLGWPDARADTIAGTGSHWSWTVNLPSAPATGSTVSLTLTALDADQPNECTLHIGPTFTLPMFGSQGVPANDAQPPTNAPARTLAPYSTPASAWIQGNNVIALTCPTNPSFAYHDITALSVSYTGVAWLTLAATLQANRWVPPWLSADDEIYVVSREDTEPARLMICATDQTTGAHFTAWVPNQLAAVPQGPAPIATQCDRAWCEASGVTRAATIRAACP